MSCYTNVSDFHAVFGHPHPDKLNQTIMNDDKLINFRIKLIEEEFNELKEACQTKNLKETIDALADIEYVLNGMAVSMGIDLPAAFNEVHASNMSKICKTKEEVLETIEYYKTLKGFENIVVGYRPCTTKSGFVVYNEADGKILKSKYFKVPDFSFMLNSS
uniref:Phosphoribosyl-ATP pyrophosphohydrolase n=1 Tax=viral metagenome TaxID=1070528 RepID=A0A6C0LRL5_9ZZZZ